MAQNSFGQLAIDSAPFCSVDYVDFPVSWNLFEVWLKKNSNDF